MTVTATQTVVQTPEAFHLRAVSDDEPLDGLDLAGVAGNPVAFQDTLGTLFSLDAQGQLRNASYSDLIANVDGTTSTQSRRSAQNFVYFNDAEDIEQDERVPLGCKIVPRDDMTCALECSTAENSVGLINSTPSGDPDYYQEWVLDTNAAGPTFTFVIIPDV